MKTKVVTELRKGAYRERLYPFIRLRGKWIADAGISIGETLDVSVTSEGILIKKIGGLHETPTDG